MNKENVAQIRADLFLKALQYWTTRASGAGFPSESMWREYCISAARKDADAALNYADEVLKD